jgi:hypothetical protein
MCTYDFIVAMCTYDFIVGMSTVPLTLLWWANQSDSLHTPQKKITPKKKPHNKYTQKITNSRGKKKIKKKSCPFS